MRENTIYYCKMESVCRYHIGYIEYWARYSKTINVYNDKNFPLKTNEDILYNKLRKSISRKKKSKYKKINKVFLEKVIYGKISN